VQNKNRVQNFTHVFARDTWTNGRLPSETHEYGSTQVCGMTVDALEINLTFINSIELKKYYIS